MKMKRLVDYFLYAFLILSTLYIFFYLYSYEFYFFSPYNHSLTAFKYDNSQYVKGPLAKLSIGDDGLYAFAGYYYLQQKGDVTKINFENPPLGKYLTGLSIMIFGNERVISIVYGFLLLLFTYKIGFKLFASKKIAVFSVILLSLSPLFLDQLTTSLIDLPMTLFFIIGLYLFIIALKNSKYIFLSSLFFGFSFSSKFFPFLPAVILILGIFLYSKNRKLLKSFIFSLLIIPVLFLLSYLSYFINNHSLLDFIKFQYWVLRWRSGNPYVVGNILRTLIFAKYQSWWDKSLYLKYDNWTILTPLIPFFGYISVLLLRIKKNFTSFMLWIIVFSYFIYVFFLTTGVEKYLLPVYPLLCVFASYTAYRLFSIIIGRHGRIRLNSH